MKICPFLSGPVYIETGCGTHRIDLAEFCCRGENCNMWVDEVTCTRKDNDSIPEECKDSCVHWCKFYTSGYCGALI
jgi:hypothetical protein